MLDLDSNQQEVYLANDNIFEMVPSACSEKTAELKSAHSLGFVVLKLDMQAVLDSDLHLDRVVAVWRHTV